jgi:hypothetical protein
MLLRTQSKNGALLYIKQSDLCLKNSNTHALLLNLVIKETILMAAHWIALAQGRLPN